MSNVEILPLNQLNTFLVLRHEEKRGELKYSYFANKGRLLPTKDKWLFDRLIECKDYNFKVYLNQNEYTFKTGSEIIDGFSEDNTYVITNGSLNTELLAMAYAITTKDLSYKDVICDLLELYVINDNGITTKTQILKEDFLAVKKFIMANGPDAARAQLYLYEQYLENDLEFRNNIKKLVDIAYKCETIGGLSDYMKEKSLK